MMILYDIPQLRFLDSFPVLYTFHRFSFIRFGHTPILHHFFWQDHPHTPRKKNSVVFTVIAF